MPRSITLPALLGLLLAVGGCPAEPLDDDSTADDDDDDSAGDDDATGDDDDAVRVRLETTLGTMVVELDEELAPITSANFLTYVDEGFYDGTDGLGATTFHRVFEDFMIQGGGQTATGASKATHDPIVNESYNGLSNVRGAIAMARTDVPDSATSQFFINHVDNLFLDIDGDYPPGYAVFGELVEGFEVLDAIAVVPANGSGLPDEPVVILATERL